MLTPTSAIESSHLPLAAVACAQRTAEAASCERRRELENILSDAMPRFRRIAMRELSNPADAEDAVQDAMLSAFRHIEQFDGRAQLSTWLTTIVINSVRMQTRRRRGRQMLSFDEDPTGGNTITSELLTDPSPTPEQTLEQSQLRDLALKLIRTLPPSQRATLRLHQRDDFSIKMASATLGVPEGTIKANLTRGRAALTERFHQATRPRRAQTLGAGSRPQRKESLSAYRHECLNGVAQMPIAAFKQGGCEGWIA